MRWLPLISASILMAYTVALANSYGHLISELKRQIQTVSQAWPLGRVLESEKNTGGEMCLTSSTFPSGESSRIKSSWHSVLWRWAQPTELFDLSAWLGVTSHFQPQTCSQIL